MNYEVLMQISDCGANLAKQVQPGLYPKSVPFTIASNRLALHVLHDQIWLLICGLSTIEQAGHVRVLQTAQDGLFTLKPASQLGRRRSHDLQCAKPTARGSVPPREVDRAHATR